jgi:hypothetical protein
MVSLMSLSVQVFGRRHEGGYPRADAAGDQKAPRHEIAMEHVTAVPGALWGFGRRGWLNEFGLKRLVRSFCR